MDNFFRYFYQDIGRVFRALFEVVISFFNFLNYLLNFPMRMEIIKEYEEEFGVVDWILLLVVNLALIALIVLLCVLFAKLLRKIFRRYIPAKKYDELVKQVKDLKRDLIRANYEKDRLLAMKMDQFAGGEEPVPEEPMEEGEEEEFVPTSNRNTVTSPCVDPQESRFFRLTSVDNYYKTEYRQPVYDNEITLAEFCERFRRYSASCLGLYYDLDMMRYFVASQVGS